MKELSIEEIQRGSLEIMKKIDEICNQLNLNYFLIYGTLIGAIRHKGFIPWDDDLDIMMPRPDYDKLIEYFIKNEKELYPLKLFSNKNNNRYPYMISRISDVRYHLVVENEDDYGIGLFVDIYPIDGVGNNAKENKKVKIKAKYLVSLCYLSTRQKCVKDNTKTKLRLMLKFPAFLYAKARGKKYFENKLNDIVAKHPYKSCTYVGCTTWCPDMEKEVFPKELLEKTIVVPFEQYHFRIPENYDKILRQVYGDYMELPPEKDRIGHHHYKAYRVQ
jgi:lipopolysaccharide cholinephosphotransferase